MQEELEVVVAVLPVQHLEQVEVELVEQEVEVVQVQEDLVVLDQIKVLHLVHL
jgi:hypothetical protein